MSISSRQKILLGIALVFIFIIHSINTSAIPIHSKDEGPPYPALQIFKTINVEDDLIQVGTEIQVSVNMTNFGGKTAINVSLVEPVLQNFTISNLKGYDPKNWIKIGPGASVSYSFSFVIEKPGNYTIEPTTATYLDENQNEYSAKSGFFELNVIKGKPPVSLDEEWRMAFIQMGSILALPIIWLLLKKYVIDK